MLFYPISAIIILIYVAYPKSKWESAVMLFTALIIQYAMLGDGHQLLGFVDHRVVSSLLLFATVYLGRDVFVVKKQYMDKYKRFALFFALFLMIVIARYIEIKRGIIASDLNWLLQAKRFTRDAIYVFAFYLIVRRMLDVRTLTGFQNGLFLGMMIAIVSMLFPSFFSKLGFNLHTGVGGGAEGEYLRQTGFLGMNSNQAGTLFNLVYGYVLAKNEQNRRFLFIHILMVALVVIGVLTVASRTAFVVMLGLTVLYLYRTKNNFKQFMINGMLVLLIGGSLFYLFGDLLQQRIDQYATGENDTLAARQSYWVMYLRDIYRNPGYLLIGNLDRPTYHRDVHNTYIQYLFYGGLFVFVAIMSVFAKIFQHRNRYAANYGYYTPLYATIALMISWITGAGQVNFWYLLIIAASSGIPPGIVKWQVSKKKNVISV